MTFQGSGILSQHSHTMNSETTMLYKCLVTMIWLQCSIVLSTAVAHILLYSHAPSVAMVDALSPESYSWHNFDPHSIRHNNIL